MEGDCVVETRLQDIEKLQLELVLDCCSSKLWKDFKRNSTLSKEMLVILRDVYIQGNPKIKHDDDLENQLHCTRFFCGLSETKQQSEDGNETFYPIHDHQSCIDHAWTICTFYPFSSAEKLHFISVVKAQVVLSAYRANKIDDALTLFQDLYDEKAGAYEEYEDDISKLFYSEHEKIKDQILKKLSHKKLMFQVADFLKPIFPECHIPFLEQEEEHLESVHEDRIPLSFLNMYHDHVEDSQEMSWHSIVNGTHPDIIEFKSRFSEKKKSKHSNKSDSYHEDNEKKKETLDLSTTKEQTHKKQKPSKKKKWNQQQEDATVIEWSDSDEDNESTSICMPKKRKKRREKKPWTEEELKYLCKGVESYGEGHWAVILRMFSFSRGRTSVDLKDKWRNYTKHF